MNWLYALVAPILFAAIVYRFGRKSLCERIEEHLAQIQFEHARWVAICLEWTRGRYDREAKIAADQVAVLRGEIDFYRRMLKRIRSTSAKART
jgi:hypothetical protein